MQNFVIIIPTLNEEAYISKTIAELAESARKFTGNDDCPIWVVDGGSTDRTIDIVRNMNSPNVDIIDNPERTQAHAVNLAASKAQLQGFQYFIRADAHATYHLNFIETIFYAMNQQNADSIVVSMTTQGGNVVQNAASVLYNSWLGNGGAYHRSGTFRGFVEHGHHALFRVSSFISVGGYDTSFLANEDAEFDHRFKEAGYSIFLENQSPVIYLPRATIHAFWKQMYRNGKYRIRTSVKHNKPLRLRQILPTILLPVLVLSILGGVFVHWSLAGAVAFYIAIVFMLSVLSLQKARPFEALVNLPVVICLAVVSHCGFSAGACSSLLHFLGKKKLSTNSSRLS